MVIKLERDAMLSLRDSRGTRIACQNGAIWITQDRDRNDIVLEPGAAHEVTCKGTAVVLALRTSRIAIEEPASQPIGSAIPELRGDA